MMGDALTRDVVAHVECIASELHPLHSVVDLHCLLSGSVMILVYPPLTPTSLMVTLTPTSSMVNSST